MENKLSKFTNNTTIYVNSERAREILNNTKIYVDGKSREIQEKLFSLGYRWNSTSKKVQYTNQPFLFIKDIGIITYTNDMEYFKNHIYKEIKLEELLSIKIIKSLYRPFKNKEECWNEILKHQSFGYIRDKVNNNIDIIMTITNVLVKLGNGWVDFETAFETIEFLDNHPFGIKEKYNDYE